MTFSGADRKHMTTLGPRAFPKRTQREPLHHLRRRLNTSVLKQLENTSEPRKQTQGRGPRENSGRGPERPRLGRAPLAQSFPKLVPLARWIVPAPPDSFKRAISR